MGAAAALVGVSTLAIGGSATAADFYVDDSDFGVEGTSYPPGWFVGGGSTGTMESTLSGLELDGVSGKIQILHGTTPTTGLVSLVNDAQFRVSSGAAYFQIPLFGNAVAAGADTNYTTLYPVDSGQPGLDSTSADAWVTTGPIMDTDGTTELYAADATASLTEFQTALGANYEILAFGALVHSGAPTATAVVSQITWAGNTHWFLPAPTAMITPASLTVDQMGNTGVSGVFTGFVPGENVIAAFSDGNSGNALPGSYTADVNGSVTVTHSAASLAPGTYFLSTFADDSGSGVSVFGSFAVVANQLAATGAEVTPFVVAGSVLLLAGAGLGAVAIRRRATAARSK